MFVNDAGMNGFWWITPEVFVARSVRRMCIAHNVVLSAGFLLLLTHLALHIKNTALL